MIWFPQTLVLGYGATRLLPRTKDSHRYGGKYGRVDNLFDPFVPLVDAIHWMTNLDENHFDYTVRSLKDVLNLDEDDYFYRQNDNVYLKRDKSHTTLIQLSDGYQSVLALTADILEIVFRIWPTPEKAHGVVLLDEVGAHLHPTWKMKIVKSLRNLFPGIQFIVTTHHPL